MTVPTTTTRAGSPPVGQPPITMHPFPTSGTTGEPVTWLRSSEQLHAEATLLAELCAADQADGIVCYAPPGHLYGYLMGLALPAVTGLPCRFQSLTAPPPPGFAGFRRPVVAALPAAAAALHRSLPRLRRIEQLTLVHGSAMLTSATADLLERLDGRASLVELFGATETGLVGWRTDPGHRWRPAADVTLGREPDGRLRVSSPRIARRAGDPQPARLDTVLDDLVDLDADRTFAWLGRANRLLKVNGRQVRLDHVEAALRAAVPAATLWCRPEADPLRGEWFTVEVGQAEQVEAVRLASRRLPGAHRPRTVRAA